MTTDDLDQEPDPGRLRSMYEEAAAKATAAEARAAELESREVFRDAGLDPKNPLHAAVMKGYDGPFESEAVTKYVTDLGINQPPAPPPDPVDPTDEATLVRIAQAAMGDGQPPPSPDRRAQLQDEMETAYRRGASKQEMDRLSEEFAQAGGTRLLRDQPGSVSW